MGTTTAYDSTEDLADAIWQVRLPNGTVQAMSIEEVEAGFMRGELDLGTRVQRPSGGDWLSIAEAAGIAGDSITPMTVATDVRSSIPRPPPLPRDDRALSAEELRVVKPRSGMGAIAGATGVAALLLGGLVAWHYLPARPTSAVAARTILAPPVTAAPATQPPPAAAPETMPPPETMPAPEGNAVTDGTVAVAKAPPPASAKPPKKAVRKKKPALKKRESVTTFTVRKHIVVRSQ